MKLRTKLYSAIICAALFIVGCNSSTSPPRVASAETVRAQGTMAADINGGSWASTAQPVYGGAATAAVIDPLTPRTLMVTGVSTNGSVISLSIPDPHVGEAVVQGTYVTDPLRFAGPGTVAISTYDTVNRLISGTFSFTATERLDSLPRNAPIMIPKVDVTNGVFSNFSWASQAGAQ
jgi:hypothetical protein